MSFKKTKVVMLPTEKSSDIILRTRDNVVHQRKYYGTAWEDMGDVYQHLYFLSDDGIKEGDWCYDEYNKVVFQNNSSGTPGASKKIIATTDKSLVVSKDTGIVGIEYNLPEPSEGFIQKFADSYNSGNPITEVMVEYDFIRGVGAEFGYKSSDIDSLKINPKDNTITTRKVKDVWTRDEVATLILQSNLDSHVAKEGEFDIMHWIEENL